MFQNMFTELAMEKCDRENKLQQWECAISNDQSSARLLTLRAQTPLAYLSTQTDDMAFWSGRIPVNLALTSKQILSNPLSQCNPNFFIEW